MSRTLYSTAVIALLLGTGGAFAQSSTTAQQPGATPAVDCPVSYTHLRAHETVLDLVCRLLLEKKNKRET